MLEQEKTDLLGINKSLVVQKNRLEAELSDLRGGCDFSIEWDSNPYITSENPYGFSQSSGVSIAPARPQISAIKAENKLQGGRSRYVRGGYSFADFKSPNFDFSGPDFKNEERTQGVSWGSGKPTAESTSEILNGGWSDAPKAS